MAGPDEITIEELQVLIEELQVLEQQIRSVNYALGDIYKLIIT